MVSKFLEDENSLLGLVAQSDTRAFTVIFDFYQPRVYSFCLPILQSEVLAEEVVQEVFLKVWQMGSKLKTIKSFDAYLKTMSRNVAIDLLRKKQLLQKVQRESQVDWSEGHNDTLESITLNETRGLIERGVLELSPQQRLIYRYILQEGLTIEEAATKMNITVSTAQTHLKIAKRYLRQFLQKHTDIAVLAILFKLL